MPVLQPCIPSRLPSLCTYHSPISHHRVTRTVFVMKKQRKRICRRHYLRVIASLSQAHCFASSIAVAISGALARGCGIERRSQSLQVQDRADRERSNHDYQATKSSLSQSCRHNHDPAARRSETNAFMSVGELGVRQQLEELVHDRWIDSSSDYLTDRLTFLMHSRSELRHSSTGSRDR